MFKEKMVTPAIPERVYALCKIVEKGPITASEIKEKWNLISWEINRHILTIIGMQLKN